MFVLKICWMALRSLQSNLLRTLLATLGVIIGVSAVVSAMSILEGTNRDVLKRFESLGADQVMVVNGTTQRHGRRTTVQTLEEDDAEALLKCELVKAVAPEVQAPAQVKYFSKNKEATVQGTTESYSAINSYMPADGEFITKEHVRAESKVCVLGHEVGKALFGETPAVGLRVKIKGQGFLVIGVMEKKGFLGFRDVDNQVIVPLTTAMNRLFGLKFLNMITVQAKNQHLLDACILQVQRALRQQHGIRAGEEDDFSVLTQEQFRSQFADVTKIFAIVLYSIAGISLVVGGIGIMNIMLVSVTERTREIGVRIAVGARRRDIMQQFLIEASIISLLGGSLGVLLGIAFTDLLENITRVLKTYTAASSVAWALLMAITVGVVSGLYPALRASRLDPVEALRYE